MRLLALEASQYGTYYVSRYQQVEAAGAELFVLNGEGVEGTWPADRNRIVGSKKIGDLIAAAADWHREHAFEGVLTFAEASVTAVAAVAEALGLPTIGPEAARTSRNKLLMRQAHQRGAAAHPAFRLVPDLARALAAGEELGYPLVLKPTLGAGSYFVFKVDSPEEMRERYPQAAEGIKDMAWVTMEADGVDLGPNSLLVESYLDGREFLIEALAWDDEVYLGSVVDRVTVEGDTFDDDVHHAPTSLTAQELAEVHRVVRVGAWAQGVRRSVLHAEVRFHRGRPFLLEIAVRPGGGGLDHMARISAGYDPIRAVADVARGVRPRVDHFRPTGVHTAAMCLVSRAGRLAAIDVPEDVSGAEELFFFKITASPGDLIKRPPEGNNILGFLGATGSSFEAAMDTATALAARIRVEFEQ
ncbi:ATP-grasp domain-containing protein [Kitasatospora sp. NPDC088134]|uniref:ATP-grasp domain-containing protein n=1 Tax=Kitasatospora sp. NPDC088134 TaxID=3364071 RepID=UPI003803A4BC